MIPLSLCETCSAIYRAGEDWRGDKSGEKIKTSVSIVLSLRCLFDNSVDQVHC